MTAHGHGSPKLAVDVMKHGGAVDFVCKPFSTADPPLERVIEDALVKLREDGQIVFEGSARSGFWRLA